VKHLYIHVPFCQGNKCHYCGFYSVMAEAHLVAMYPELLPVEAHLRAKVFPELFSQPLETIYLGGGTPALLGPEGLHRLAAGLRKGFNCDSVTEWTIELNPAHVNLGLMRALRAIGVNRVSIGVQSFCERTLERIGRHHSTQAILDAVRLAQHEGFSNVGIDLIAGLPGVTEAEWRATLEQALALDVTHLSVYALSVEAGTALERQVKEGALVLPSDDAQLDALAMAEESLGRAGYERYEISNYALPGYACKHNVEIWKGNDYLGLGPAAASRIGAERWTTRPRLADYVEAVLQDQLPPSAEAETLLPAEDARERVMFSLRLKEGFDPYAAAQRYPELGALADGWEERLERFARQGIVERGGLRWRLTARGREVCDAVIREIF
jgi:oxygen-independent coproporphyrinogen III oxidase